MDINRIIEIVCSDEDYMLDPEFLNIKTKISKILEARQISHYFAHEMTTLSYAKIGQKIGGKDHASVMHSCKKVKEYCETDKRYAERFKRIEGAIKKAAESEHIVYIPLEAVFILDEKLGGYTAWFKDYPNIITEGETIAEANENLKNAFLDVARYFIMSAHPENIAI